MAKESSPSISGSVFEIPISFSGSSSARSSAENGEFNTGGVNFAADYTESIVIAAVLIGVFLLIKKG